MTDESRSVADELPGGNQGKKGGNGWLAFGCLAPILALFVSCTILTQSGSDDHAPSSADAIVACRESVKINLKDPDSAKFSDEVGTRTTTGYTVAGTVRATNSLGGPAIHAYTCTTSGTTSDQRVTDLRIAP